MFKQTQRIERLHQLIKRKATGTPKECSSKLGISERQLYNTIELMKELGAPIIYNNRIGTYAYEFEVEWSLGFRKRLSEHKMSDIQGSGFFHQKNATAILFQS